MPKRQDIKKILIIGSGPIIIGQACEFDYSGSQACKALKEEGYEIILVNSNPATIMTDPSMADKTYIEPLIPETLTKIIQKEKPDAILPTLGGQIALNLAVELSNQKVLQTYNAEMIGVKVNSIKKTEDRELFKKTMQEINLAVPKGGIARNLEQAIRLLDFIPFPAIIRPSFTLGGTGAGVAYNVEEYKEMVEWALSVSPIQEILVEESLIGWKEYELEVMRDSKDNVVIICSIENFDPMGIHTGDSITVAPAQTLTDKEYQIMRDAALKIIRAIGIETGGSNIQFALNPKTGRMLVIEMNPRVSRSSALASKATGFPIAKIAAKLAVGYTLDEIPNDITKETPASFEPTLDYCVVKIPRWDFEKFPDVDSKITTQMKSIGEVMAIGRTFKEAFQKALRSLEQGEQGIGVNGLKDRLKQLDIETIKSKLRVPSPDRLFYLQAALVNKIEVEEIRDLTGIDPWFIYQIKQILELEKQLIKYQPKVKKDGLSSVPRAIIKKAKQFGLSDSQIGNALNQRTEDIRKYRQNLNIKSVVKCVDTCAGEFEAYTPYYYLTYEEEDEVRPSLNKKIMILGGGPNRIGQGIEFDYCCVQGAYALQEEGMETIMVNSNPETVSTDYDTSDKLYFEPLYEEDILNIIEKEKPDGVIVQLGGQTPLNLIKKITNSGIKIIGTSPDKIDQAEDRRRFRKLISELKLNHPPGGMAFSVEEAIKEAQKIGYPVLVRPSYVIGGRAMEVVYSDKALKYFIYYAVKASPDYPILIDEFIEDAIEVDVDAISDGDITVIGGIMEHIEEAGIHSGDSSCVIPPVTLVKAQIEEIRRQTKLIAQRLKVKGLLNIQFAIKGDIIYVLEVNPRASRTIPYVSKAIGVPLAKLATKIMLGKKLKEFGFSEEIVPEYFSVKCPVFPFNKLPGVDPILGPEMKSTGEVMGIDSDFGQAFAKAYIAAGHNLPLKGTVFISVKNKDKRAVIFIAKKLSDLGFNLVATQGTAGVLKKNGLNVRSVFKVYEGRPNVIDLIKNKEIDLTINTPTGQGPKQDSLNIRKIAIKRSIPCITTISGAYACVTGIEALSKGELKVFALQDYHS
ncbi:MAG: carbamoyl-phosphate synthase large subunit [Candidatus Aminicenantia bacterium]